MAEGLEESMEKKSGPRRSPAQFIADQQRLYAAHQDTMKKLREDAVRKERAKYTAAPALNKVDPLHYCME